MKKEDSSSPASDIPGDVVGTLTMLLTEVDDDDEAELSEEFTIKEEKIEEIMRELYKEITSSAPSKVPSPSPSPSYSSSLPFDVKSESCGASVSVSGSTLMVGIEYPPGGKVGLSENGGWKVGKGDIIINNGVGEKMDGCDLLDVGDEWLARVLRWGPPIDLEEFK